MPKLVDEGPAIVVVVRSYDVLEPQSQYSTLLVASCATKYLVIGANGPRSSAIVLGQLPGGTQLLKGLKILHLTHNWCKREIVAAQSQHMLRHNSTLIQLLQQLDMILFLASINQGTLYPLIIHIGTRDSHAMQTYPLRFSQRQMTGRRTLPMTIWTGTM